MLGIFLLYFIGKRFYDLAALFGRHKWFYAILSIVVYYGVGALLVALVVILDLMVFEWNFDWEASWGVSYISIPFGLLGVWIFDVLLKNRWEKLAIVVIDEIQDIGKSDNSL